MTDFEPPLAVFERPREPPQRSQNASRRADIGEILRPRIDLHLATAMEINEQLARRHQMLPDTTDLDVDAPSRWLAQWEIGGRAIALHRALVDQLRLGYGPETAGTMRMLLEALLLLHVTLDPDLDEETRAWMSNSRVPAGATRRHVRDQEEQIIERLQARGEPEPELSYFKTMKDSYDWLAARTHNNRETIGESVDRDSRVFLYGPPDDRLTCAAYTEMTMSLTRPLLMLVGSSINLILRDGWYESVSTSLFARVDDVAREHPIHLEARREAAT